MISATNQAGKTLATAATGTEARRGKNGNLPAAGGFSDLFHSHAAGQSRAAHAAVASTRPSQAPAAAAASTAAPARADLPNQPAGLPVQPADLPVAFSPQAIENHMNQWLMSITRQQNEIRTQIYNNAVEGWKNTNARNRELGLPEIPPPPPPELAEVAPMPEGWWFRNS